MYACHETKFCYCSLRRSFKMPTEGCSASGPLQSLSCNRSEQWTPRPQWNLELSTTTHRCCRGLCWCTVQIHSIITFDYFQVVIHSSLPHVTFDLAYISLKLCAVTVLQPQLVDVNFVTWLVEREWSIITISMMPFSTMPAIRAM